MRSSWETLGYDTLRSVAVMALSVFVIGCSYGVAGHSAGLSWWQIVTIACVVMAGSSEFVFVGILATGGLPIVGALAGLLVNTRNLGYGLSVGPYLGSGVRRLIGAHMVNDETAALTAGTSDAERARAAFLWCGIGVLVSWPAGAALGSAAGQVISSPETLGLDAAFPALLGALAISALRGQRSERGRLGASLVVGAVIAVAATPYVPAGVPVLLALVGLGAGLLVPRRGTDDSAHSAVDSALPDVESVHATVDSALATVDSALATVGSAPSTVDSAVPRVGRTP
ncbi:AzlC family ABC transporter permease [Gordonia sputi]